MTWPDFREKELMYLMLLRTKADLFIKLRSQSMKSDEEKKIPFLQRLDRDDWISTLRLKSGGCVFMC